jgi:lysozyme family protein
MKLLVVIPLCAALLVPSQLARFTGETQAGRWSRAEIKALRAREIDRIVDRIAANRARYEAVARETGVPWHVIAALHNMEASGSFAKHLHEGSSLSGRTRWEPKGRPVNGRPPFKWEDSAQDALRFDRLDEVAWRKLEAALWACERYNGTGYAKYHPQTPTPYLWSGTTLYSRGKYVADGKWDPMAVSGQIGVAAIWKRMIQRNLIPEP